jgi:fatty acid desaturase
MLVHDMPAASARAPEPLSRVEGGANAEEFTRKIGMRPAELSALIADLSPLRDAIYWGDLLATSSVAYAAFWLALSAAHDPWREALCLALSACAVYRMTLFTHELAHAPAHALRAFRVVWNLVCGVPLLVPSFLYEVHAAHHDRRSYACAEDGEYRAFALAPRVEGLASLVAPVLAVPALVFRFLVLAPLGWMIPPLRRFVLKKISALVIDFGYSRSLPRPLPARWAVQEAACFGWCVLLLGLISAGRMDPGVLLRGYAVLTGAIFMNALRVLCAHRYRGSGAPMSFVDQVLDSNNFPRGLAWVWAPLGLRYHAVHHLFPKLPYHALGEAYRRLMSALPQHSAFRLTCRRSFLAGLDDVVGRRQANGRSS